MVRAFIMSSVRIMSNSDTVIMNSDPMYLGISFEAYSCTVSDRTRFLQRYRIVCATMSLQRFASLSHFSRPVSEAEGLTRVWGYSALRWWQRHHPRHPQRRQPPPQNPSQPAGLGFLVEAESRVVACPSLRARTAPTGPCQSPTTATLWDSAGQHNAAVLAPRDFIPITRSCFTAYVQAAPGLVLMLCIWLSLLSPAVPHR